ncbi:MAG: SEC-C domain-containing protein [Acidobacteriia bacterium]|nr:SEC-C domain-containing protein [Terriglobia bacterium]
MLFLSESVRKQRLEIGREMQAGTLGEVEAAQRLLQLDPNSGAAFLSLGNARAAAGDLAEAESLFWQGLDRNPCAFTFYMALSDLRRRRDPADVLANRLRMLGMWKLSFSVKIPDEVAAAFQGKSEKFDFKDPVTYEMFATAMEVQDKDTVDPPEVSDCLLPYRLLNDLQRQAPTLVEYRLVRDILANSARCLPLWRAALREWAKDPLAVSPRALALIIALLGEIAGVDVLDDFLELATFDDDEIFLHTHWAIWRIGQRLPSETLAKFRAATPSARPALRCGLADQMNLLPEVDGIGPALIGLLEGFSGFADDIDAPYLLLMVAAALDEFGLDAEAQRVFDQYQGILPRKGGKTLDKLTESEEGFIPKLVEKAFDGLTIEDVCIKRKLMVDDDDEEEQEEEVDEEELSVPKVPRVKPERNAPCWCGSGKKYKKCHLAADEEAERSPVKAEPARPVGDPFYKALFGKVLDSADEIRSRAEILEASRLYFDRDPRDVDPEETGAGGFFDWLVYDFRPGGTGRTLVEEYLRRRGGRLGARERALLESWRAARFGLFEVQRIDKETGVELKDVFAGDQFFVHDVSSSRSSVRWDCIMTRVQEFEGRRIFSGNGLILPRPLLSRFVAVVEEESRKAGQAPAEFVRANSHRWHRTIQEIHKEQITGLKVVNAEGDAIEFCSATYLVLDEEGLAATLGGMKVFEETTEESDPPGVRYFGWLETGVEESRRSYGHIEIRDGRLRLECNSRRRLQIGRQLLEKNAGSFLKHQGDVCESLDEAKERMSREKPKEETAQRVPSEEERELVLQFKAEHYATWPDEPLPALGGRTPREAVRSEVGRREVDDLLRMMENGEERLRKEGGPAFDFSPIRKTLGLDR